MRLTQIKLAGFKSFVDTTIIACPSQFVGIVGPNGCGKSNIIDAVRWVLGEAKASELRGESMQDVIFNGSGHRKPAARASVEMVFDNSAGRAAGKWSAYTEIAVRRVLTRDGNSSYWVNNQQVRRRDIHDIFLGTGLGTRGYAIIGQGMINRLIEARPDVLRVCLEEAAGVSRYKARRSETEGRLADTRENLTRVEDILRELTVQVEKLAAQAEVAKTYHALQADGEQKQHTLWWLKASEARLEKNQKMQAIDHAQQQLEAAMADLRACESALELRRQAHEAASSQAHTRQGHFYDANAQISRVEAEIEHIMASRQRLQSRGEQLHQQIAEWRAQYTHYADQCVQAEVELEGAIEQAAQTQTLSEAAQATLPELENRWRDAVQAREAGRRALAQVEQELALVAQRQRALGQQREEHIQRRDRLQQTLRALPQPDSLNVQHLAGEVAAGQRQLEVVQEEMTALEARLPDLDAQRAAAHTLVQQEIQTLAQVEARLSALLKLQEEIQQPSQLEPWLAKHQLSGLARLWQKLQVATGWEKAVEAILRECMLALEVPSLEWAQACVQEMPPVRLAFYQLPTALPVPSPTPGLQPLTALLRVTDADVRTLLHNWLRDIYVLDTLEQALANRAALPPGGAYVVQDGHWIDAHCVRFYAADSEQAGLLVRQQEIIQLQRERKAQHLIVTQKQADVARLDAAWQEGSQTLVTTRQRVAEVMQRVHAQQLDYTQLQQQGEQAQAQRAHMAETLAELEEAVQALYAEAEIAQAHHDTLEETHAEHQAREATAVQRDEALAIQVETARSHLRTCERAEHEAEFTRRGIETRIQDAQRHQQLAAEQKQRAEAELEALQGELTELDVSTLQARLQEALVKRTECEEALSSARIEMDNLAAQLRQDDEARMRLAQSLEPYRAGILELQLQEQAARLAEEQFSEQLRARNVDCENLAQQLATLPETWRDAKWLQSEVARISRKVDALGSVNLAALEELTSAQTRQQFLEAQQEDLLTAIATLEDAVRKIDRETRELLQETFNLVNGYFGELFPQLFGGGQAKLMMTGDEILDAGVQVMAQPPGKRNSTIHLLSGGEKALTAIALVFALFKLNPAPFCLLDEVDAPLDDANTERYVNLVNAMSTQTQFLFISHNKIAMQRAKHLVGVTMQEQGVSRIVAVDIDAAIQWAAKTA